MSIDLAYPPFKPSEEIALQISQQAPRLLRSSTRSLPWPLSIFSPDETPESWASYETVYQACLRTGDDKSAKLIIEKLIDRFGDTNERIIAYQGMWAEAMAENEKDCFDVLKEYGEILDADPTNMPVQRRRIALLKSMNRIQEAVTQLVGLLQVSPVDAEAWAELSELYLNQGKYEQAIFCLEEVLLIAPNAWNMHAKLAEVIYMSSKEISNNAELSRVLAESMKRYCRSVELCENYLRGYYGLKLVVSKLLPILPASLNSSSQNSTYGDVSLPTEGTTKALHELATSKLAEIVRRSSAGEKGWDGYDAAELKAARELLDKDGGNLQR